MFVCNFNFNHAHIRKKPKQLKDEKLAEQETKTEEGYCYPQGMNTESYYCCHYRYQSFLCLIKHFNSFLGKVKNVWTNPFRSHRCNHMLAILLIIVVFTTTIVFVTIIFVCYILMLHFKRLLQLSTGKIIVNEMQSEKEPQRQTANGKHFYC